MSMSSVNRMTLKKIISPINNRNAFLFKLCSRMFPYLDRILSVFSRIWTESYPYFPLFGQNLQFCPNT